MDFKEAQKELTGAFTLKYLTQGFSEATCWNNCTERVRGSDGTQFPPGVTRNETLNVWVPQLYRVLPFVFREDTQWLGVNFQRFWPVSVAPRRILKCVAFSAVSG